jgi:hypothetical protein
MNFSPTATGISAQGTLDYHKEKHDYKNVADNESSVHVAQGIVIVIINSYYY